MTSAAGPEFAGVEIVIIDDEAPVAEGIAIMLELEGASVATVDRGRDAIALLERRADAPDLFVIDLGLPEMSGDQLHAELRRRLPGVPIIVSSGYGEQPRIQSLLESPRTRFLRKPYEMSDLYAVVRELLGGR